MSRQLHSCLDDPEEGGGGERERREGEEEKRMERKKIMRILHSLHDILMAYQASDDFISGRCKIPTRKRRIVIEPTLRLKAYMYVYIPLFSSFQRCLTEDGIFSHLCIWKPLHNPVIWKGDGRGKWRGGREGEREGGRERGRRKGGREEGREGGREEEELKKEGQKKEKVQQKQALTS